MNLKSKFYNYYEKHYSLLGGCCAFFWRSTQSGVLDVIAFPSTHAETSKLVISK